VLRITVYFGPSKMVVLVAVALAFGSALYPACSRAAFASANPVFDVGMTVTLQPVAASPWATRTLPSTTGTSLFGKLEGMVAAEALELAFVLDEPPEEELEEEPVEQPASPPPTAIVMARTAGTKVFLRERCMVCEFLLLIDVFYWFRM
jgi:hypothetical protein